VWLIRALNRFEILWSGQAGGDARGDLGRQVHWLWCFAQTWQRPGWVYARQAAQYVAETGC
jgi:hypothetical protein